jgi:SPX domain protein involved in polyphosphate accumulation
MHIFDQIELDKNRFRNEIKYKFYSKNLSSWKTRILRSKSNFQVHHEPRWINNIYFDTMGLDFFKQSHEGSSPRVKIRLRWYGDFFNNFKKYNLEFKIKNSNKNTKISFPISNILIFNGMFISSISSLIQKHTNLPDEVTNVFYSIRPTLVNRYKRDYFLHRKDDTRLTLDNSLCFKSVLTRSKLSSPVCENKNLTIIELKFDKKNNINKEIMNEMSNNLKISQFSKYTYGVQNS